MDRNRKERERGVSKEQVEAGGGGTLGRREAGMGSGLVKRDLSGSVI